jgi:hypothetical protein
MSKSCGGRERRPGGLDNTSPYFQYGRLGGMKETMGANSIFLRISEFRGKRKIWLLTRIRAVAMPGFRHGDCERVRSRPYGTKSVCMCSQR